MTNQQESAMKVFEHFFKIKNGCDVHMVGGLIQKKNIWLLNNSFSKHHSSFPAPR